MTEVAANHVEMIDECQRLRGGIANGYAQVEFLLGDLIDRARNLEEYHEIIGRIPHGAPDRVKKIRSILEREGRLLEFKHDLERIVEEFERSHETRNLLAHGFCEFLHTPDGDMGLNFKKFHRDREANEDRLLMKCFRLVDMQYEQAQVVHLSDEAVHLFYRIHERFGWVAQ